MVPLLVLPLLLNLSDGVEAGLIAANWFIWAVFTLGGSPLATSYVGASQVERTTAGPTSFTNSLLGVTAATDTGATTATTRDPAGALVGLRSGADRSYYVVDGLGSVATITDASGGVTHSYAYDPYGVTTETTSSAVANPWRYTGQYQDVSTGLYKMGARYYQPELGRWTQPDPSGLDSNAYLYVGGNPVNFVDPSGLSVFSEFKDYLTAEDAGCCRPSGIPSPATRRRSTTRGTTTASPMLRRLPQTASGMQASSLGIMPPPFIRMGFLVSSMELRELESGKRFRRSEPAWEQPSAAASALEPLPLATL
jgi:RHS repeat-associated protein